MDERNYVSSHKFFVRYIKRLFDILVALIAIVVTLPLNLVLAVLTLLDVGRPIIFKQMRAGKDGVPFVIRKFRNMTNETDENGKLLPADRRVTRFGRIVRATSLDELLQFYNILFGQMSVIGPRPLKVETMARCNDVQRRRLLIKPGLDCPLREGNELRATWDIQFENDVWYVQNCSFKVDLCLTLRLVCMVFDRRSMAERSKASRKALVTEDLAKERQHGPIGEI